MRRINCKAYPSIRLYKSFDVKSFHSPIQIRYKDSIASCFYSNMGTQILIVTYMLYIADIVINIVIYCYLLQFNDISQWRHA